MIIRQVSIELNEKQYEKLCQVAASAGKTVRKVLQTFAEDKLATNSRGVHPI